MPGIDGSEDHHDGTKEPEAPTAAGRGTTLARRVGTVSALVAIIGGGGIVGWVQLFRGGTDHAPGSSATTVPAPAVTQAPPGAQAATVVTITGPPDGAAVDGSFDLTGTVGNLAATHRLWLVIRSYATRDPDTPFYVPDMPALATQDGSWSAHLTRLGDADSGCGEAFDLLVYDVDAQQWITEIKDHAPPEGLPQIPYNYIAQRHVVVPGPPPSGGSCP